eukprot:scpid33312/ scgid0850/ Sodium-dependent glucose transporter 1
MYCCCGVFLCLRVAQGVILSMLGPTLLDLSHSTGEPLDVVSYVFTTRSIGYLIGSIVAGLLFDRFDANFLLAVSLCLSAVGTLIAPMWKKVVLLAMSTFVQGISMGFLDTGGNVLLLQIWGKDNGPYMQALHFCFGLGAMVSPLIAKPFISPARTHNCSLITASPAVSSVSTVPISNALLTTVLGGSSPSTAGLPAAALPSLSTSAAHVSSTASTVVTPTNASDGLTPLVIARARRSVVANLGAAAGPTDCPLNPLQFTGRFKYAFFISAVPLLIAGLLFAFFACRKRGIHHANGSSKSSPGGDDAKGNTTSGKDDEETGTGGRQASVAARLVGCVRWRFLLVLALFFMLYVGEEVAFGSYVFTYGVRSPYLKLSSADAALLTSTFWGLFAVGRFLAIPLAYCKVPAGAMVGADLTISFVAAVILLAFEQSRHAIFFGSAMLGLGMSSVFPAAISWAEQYTEINSKAAISFVVGAALGEMIGPIVLGHLFESEYVGPRSFLVFTISAVCASIGVFLVLFAMARRRSLCSPCGAAGRAAAIDGSSKRRHLKTRRERNAGIEMSKQARANGGGVGVGVTAAARSAWHSSDSSSDVL